MTFRFPGPLYPIADAGTAPDGSLLTLVEEILSAGVRLFQLRAKDCSTRQYVEAARAVKQVADPHGAQLIVNDRADIARLVDASGVHLGQDDLDPRAARALLGPGKVIGFSTHSQTQLRAALELDCVDYLAFGPVFPTSSKARTDPVQGLEHLRNAARITSLPLVAIGGITVSSIADVIVAGADAAAVIGAIIHLLRRAQEATTLRDRRRN